MYNFAFKLGELIYIIMYTRFNNPNIIINDNKIVSYDSRAKSEFPDGGMGKKRFS
jgi:outer membrane lipoprotein-sorting protein